MISLLALLLLLARDTCRSQVPREPRPLRLPARQNRTPRRPQPIGRQDESPPDSSNRAFSDENTRAWSSASVSMHATYVLCS
ncbi:hypothetical protein OH77DRAFT_1424948 [Trametes cingulata]|nr:hypothetical protein OH77DRAFT_1424948 [Trametes cingulata]